MNQLMLFDQRSLLVHDSRDSAHSKSFDSLYCGMRCVKVASGSRERSTHTHTLTLHSCSFMTFMFFGLQHVSIGFAFARLWRHSDSRGLQTTTSNNVYSIYIIYIYIIYLIYIYIDIHAMCSCRQIKLTSSSVFLWLKRQPLDVDATVATTGCLQSSWFCLPWVTWLSLAQLKMLDSDPLAG